MWRDTEELFAKHRSCNIHHMPELTSENKVLVAIRKNKMGDNGLKSSN